MSQVLETISMKLIFRTIKIHSWKGKKTGEMLERWKDYMSRKLLFKYFANWKHHYYKIHNYHKKLKIYQISKQQERLSNCFSILKLGYKRGMIKQLKAERHYNSVLKLKIFESIVEVTQ